MRAIKCLLVLLAGMWLQTAGAVSDVADAAQSGDLDRVNQLLAEGSDVNSQQADGTTALLWATFESYPDMVTALLDAGADPNVANEFGITPLLQASRYGDAPVVAALLAGGADIAITHPTGETALMAAARSGSVETVALLLEAGSDVNAVENFEGQTALMWASAEGHLDVVDALLNAGADPNIKARESELTKRSTRTDFPTGGFTAVMWAARSGDLPLVERLVEGGADLNVTNGDGATPMMLAIINDRFDFAVKLLELGAGVDDGSLYRAVEMRDATTDWLAKDGTRLRADYPNELTALDLMRVLLDAGADPNRPYSGQMHSASMCCDTFEHGSPMFRAATAADIAALELLIEHGGDVNWSPEKSDREAETGLAAGPPPNRNVGKTPLMMAMNGGKGVGMAGGPGDIREGRPPPFREEANREPVDAVRLLLESGADPDKLTPEGEAVLHMAAKAGKLDIIEVLAEYGANLEIENEDGETALAIVEKMEPRPPPPLTGALAGIPQGAQPAEVAVLLRELMGLPPATEDVSETQ